MIERTSGVTPRPFTVIQGGAAKPAERPQRQQDQVDVSIPATPPPEVLADLDRAAQVLNELSRRNVALHFEVDSQSKRIRVQVLDGDGRVVREIPATRLMDVLSGGSGQGLAVSAVG